MMILKKKKKTQNSSSEYFRTYKDRPGNILLFKKFLDCKQGCLPGRKRDIFVTERPCQRSQSNRLIRMFLLPRPLQIRHISRSLGRRNKSSMWHTTPTPPSQGNTVHIQFSSVQSPSHVRLFVTPWTAARQASLSITNSRSSPKPMSIESVMPSNHPILCRPLLLLPSIFPSIKVFSNKSQHQGLCIRWPKYWNFSFSSSPSNEHPGLISFRMDWLDLLAVQGTLKSLLQHHSSKASILQHSAL